MEKTLTFSEKVKGFTSFHSFIPDAINFLNNRLFSIKDGQLYLHNQEDVPRNNFYGEQFTSKVELVFNELPSDDKIFKSINLEGNTPWNISLHTNLSESTIKEEEFQKRESRYFAYTRRNENNSDNTSLSTQGIGLLESFNNNILNFNGTTEYLSTNDEIYQVVNNANQLIGSIQSIDKLSITVALQNTPVPGSFCFAKKPARIEGGPMRGYYMKAVLENSNTEPIELFSVGCKIVKSYV
jgi:hypothetical protein